MDTNKLNNIDALNEESEESGFITDVSAPNPLEFGNLFSNKFSNITPLYRSTKGPTQIFTATRYGKRLLLKGLKEQFRNDPVYIMTLVKEFEVGITLDHPNIRNTIEIATLDHIGKVIVLEYIDGQTLEQQLTTGCIDSDAAFDIVRQIIDALRYIHSKNLFHRDLKPSNILLSYNSHAVKLIDFNLADSPDFIILKNPAGTNGYIAPEQLSKDAKPTVAADIYSLGVIINQIAETAKNPILAQVANICRNPDPTKRPKSVNEIQRIIDNKLNQSFAAKTIQSKQLTFTLLATAAALTTFIIYNLI